jgi:hypothetical protein
VIVVKAPEADVDVTCAGFAMVTGPAGSSRPCPLAGTPQVELGKRYASEEAGIEVICTRSGTGPLACDGHELARQGAKALPASD